MKIKLEKIKFGTPYKMSGNINEIFEEKSVFLVKFGNSIMRNI